MKKIISTLFTVYCVFFNATIAFAKEDPVISQDNVLTINGDIVAQVYSFKKRKHYTVVEIGFTNPTHNYIEFTPKEIFLDDDVKYSLPPLTTDEVARIEQKKPGMSILPLALAAGLGIASLATSRVSNDASFGLGVAALSAGGAALLTSGLENQAKKNKLITFENNRLDGIKRLPPGMTLGGLLYFPPTKNPKSLTVIATSKNGSFEKKTFDLSGVKSSQKKKSKRS